MWSFSALFSFKLWIIPLRGSVQLYKLPANLLRIRNSPNNFCTHRNSWDVHDACRRWTQNTSNNRFAGERTFFRQSRQIWERADFQKCRCHWSGIYVAVHSIPWHGQSTKLNQFGWIGGHIYAGRHLRCINLIEYLSTGHCHQVRVDFRCMSETTCTRIISIFVLYTNLSNIYCCCI